MPLEATMVEAHIKQKNDSILQQTVRYIVEVEQAHPNPPKEQKIVAHFQSI